MKEKEKVKAERGHLAPRPKNRIVKEEIDIYSRNFLKICFRYERPKNINEKMKNEKKKEKQKKNARLSSLVGCCRGLIVVLVVCCGAWSVSHPQPPWWTSMGVLLVLTGTHPCDGLFQTR